MASSGRFLIERLFAEHYSALLAFFQRRARSRADVPDLAQEVYLRMLRVGDPDSIRSPEQYLFTVANNLLRETAVLERRRARSVGTDEADAEPQLQHAPVFDEEVDLARRITRLRVVLAQLPPKCRAVVLLQYQHGLSYEEIAARLGISTHMVKKYLSQALTHCRTRMSRLA